LKKRRRLKLKPRNKNRPGIRGIRVLKIVIDLCPIAVSGLLPGLEIQAESIFTPGTMQGF
jgi:hypothetical protein